jgi:hypothetical protein
VGFRSAAKAARASQDQVETHRLKSVLLKPTSPDPDLSSQHVTLASCAAHRAR